MTTKEMDPHCGRSPHKPTDHWTGTCQFLAFCFLFLKSDSQAMKVTDSAPGKCGDFSRRVVFGSWNSILTDRFLSPVTEPWHVQALDISWSLITRYHLHKKKSPIFKTGLCCESSFATSFPLVAWILTDQAWRSYGTTDALCVCGGGGGLSQNAKKIHLNIFEWNTTQLNRSTAVHLTDRDTGSVTNVSQHKRKSKSELRNATEQKIAMWSSYLCDSELSVSGLHNYPLKHTGNTDNQSPFAKLSTNDSSFSDSFFSLPRNLPRNVPTKMACQVNLETALFTMEICSVKQLKRSHFSDKTNKARSANTKDRYLNNKNWVKWREKVTKLAVNCLRQ